MAKEKTSDPMDLSDPKVHKRKKKSKSRTKEGSGSSRSRPKFCPNSSKSFNASRTFHQHHVSTTALKKNNEELAKSLNKCKVAIAALQAEKLALERDNMDLRAENSTQRALVDHGMVEAEVQKRLVDYLGPVKRHINSAIDNMVGLSDNLTQSMQLVSAPLRMSTQSQSSVGASRGSSIGANFRMRPVANFQMRDGGSSGNSPPKQLSKVSPMVAGHAISRPRIQLTRMDIAAMSAAREQFGQQLGDEAETDENLESEEEAVEITQEVAEEVFEPERDEFEEIEASPPHPGRSRFNLTNIGEESSMLEESRVEDSIMEESREEVEHMEQLEMLEEEESQEEREGLSPEQSFRRRSRSSVAVRQSLGQARLSVGQAVTGRQSSSTASAETARLSPASQAGSSRQSAGRVGNVRQSLGQVFRQETSTGPSPPSQGRLSRPPLRDLSVPSPSPQVDILKTQRHPAVVLSDLVTMNHPALPSRYSQPSSTPLMPTPSPACNKRTSAPIIPVVDFPEDPSESFLERMCDNDPLEGPSWLFAPVNKKKRRSSAVRKLSAVWSDSERGSTMGSSGRVTTSLDTSDIDVSSGGEGASSREVSGYVLDRDLLETAVVVNTPDLTLYAVEATPARPVNSSSSSVSVALSTVTAFEEDMELTRTAGMVVDGNCLNSSNQENNPVELVSSHRIDESNISISVSHTPRTPLSSLTYTDPSGEVVKFNPRTDTGVTVAGLREAQILLNNVGMVDNTGRATTPYKLSECYIDLSPGRSMSLDQLFSLGLRAGISSPIASPRLKKRKHASEVQASRGTPPSKKSRVTDLPSMRQKSVRASLDMIPPPNMTNFIVNRAAIASLGDGSPLKNLPTVKVTRATADQEIFVNTANEKSYGVDNAESINNAKGNERIDDDLNCGEAPISNAVLVDKNKKKSVMPSFVMLENSPVKTSTSIVTEVIEEDSVQVDYETIDNMPCVANEIDNVMIEEVNEEVVSEVEETDVAKVPERPRRTNNKVDYAVLQNGEDDSKTSIKNKSSKKVSEVASKKVQRGSSIPLKEAEKSDEMIVGVISVQEASNVDNVDVQLVVESSKMVNKTKTASRMSKASKKQSNSKTPVVVESDEEPESVPQTSEAVEERVEAVTDPVSEADPIECKGGSRKTGDALEACQVESSRSEPASSLRGSSVGAPSSDSAEGRGGRSRRGAAQVSYKEPALGKKLRQGDAGSTSVYSDFKADKKNRKSGKKK